MKPLQLLGTAAPLKLICRSAATLVASASLSQAASIAVQNFSFESPNAQNQPGVGQGDYVLAIPNWTSSVGVTSSYGFVQIATSGGFTAAPNGVQYAGNYDNARNVANPVETPGNTIYFYQHLNVAFQANSTYTVTIAIGNRNIGGNADDGLTSFGLFSSGALGTDVGTAVTVNGDTQVTLNQFQDFTYTFTTGAIAPAGNVTAYWRATADGGTGIRAAVDNFRVDVVPEPSAMLLGAMGSICLLRRRRR